MIPRKWRLALLNYADFDSELGKIITMSKLKA
jgi:hypothetical protein